MSNRILGILLVVVGLLALHLFGGPPETKAIWKISVESEILSQPIKIDSDIFLINAQNQILKMDFSGKIVLSKEISAMPAFPIIPLASSIIVLDKEGRIQGYSAKDLSVVFTSQLLELPRVRPIPLPENRFLIAGARNVFFSVDGTTGKKVWETHLPGNIIEVTIGKTLACIYGYDDLNKPLWKLAGIDMEDGELLWTHNENIDDKPPLVYADHFIFCNKDGRPIAVDQTTGEEKFRYDHEGYKIVDLIDDSLYLLAQGGAQLEALSIATGTSWSATLPSPLLKIFGAGDRLIVVDGKSIRCLNSKNADFLWQGEMGKTFDAYYSGTGVFVTYKDSFIDRPNYFSAFNPQSGEIAWTCYDTKMFYAPITVPKGEIVFSMSGNIRLMPGLPPSKSEKNTVFSAIASPSFSNFFPSFTPSKPSSGTNRIPNKSEKKDKDTPAWE